MEKTNFENNQNNPFEEKPEQTISVLLNQGADHLNQPDIKNLEYKEPEPQTFSAIPIKQISSIFSWNFDPKGDPNHLPIDTIVELFKTEKFKWSISNYRDPIKPYKLPDDSYHIQSGRHRVIAAILSGQPEIEAAVYQLKSPIPH